MNKLFVFLFSSLLISTACAEKQTITEAKPATENVVEAPKVETLKAEKEKSVVITKAGESFETIKENVEAAIADAGMIVSGTLHVSDMLNRTGKDIGFEKNIFKKSEAVEFCSSVISHKMAVAHPSNISMCPFTVAIYELNDEPDVIYLSYRRVKLLGDGKKVEEEIVELLQTIVDDSVE